MRDLLDGEAIYSPVTIVNTIMGRQPVRHRLLLKQLDALTRDAEAIYDGDSAAVHATRVASRRLRELLPLLQFDGDTARNLRRRLKKLTNRLGAVRELDVLLLLIRELGRDPRCSNAAVRHMRAEIEEARAAAHERLASKFPLERIHRLARRLERESKRRTAGGTPARRPGERRARGTWLWALQARTTHRAVGVQAAVKSAGTVYRLEGLHGVRIALKKLRYAAELGAHAQQTPSKASIATLKRAQDLLGRLHDLEVLIVRIRHVQVSLSPPDVTTWRKLASLVRTVEGDCRVLHARYLKQRSKLVALAERLGAPGRGSRPAVGAVAASQVDTAPPQVEPAASEMPQPLPARLAR